MQISHVCNFCGKVYSVTVEDADWKKYQSGALVQDVFPYLPPIERDIAVGRFCSDCGYSMFHVPKPGEDWGAVVGECQVCGTSLYEHDIDDSRAFIKCPSCGFPNELDSEGHIIEAQFDEDEEC